MSVIICTYGRPAQVARLLETLCRQTLTPDEVLVVDGSRDSLTEDVVRAAGNGRASHQRDDASPSIVYHRVTERERGLTRQRNVGIERARGKVVVFLDDDTRLEPDYLAAIAECFARHPAAGGVGGYITNEVAWTRPDNATAPRLDTFRWHGWERREDYRWRVRKLLGLDASAPPGWLPPSGHGRPVGFLPPDGNDYQVEFFMGGASAWRREVFATQRFSLYFDGYGLYEDLDFCLRVSRMCPLYLCTSARLEHHHAPESRPNAFRYGVMVVRNGWYVWRRRWPRPEPRDRARWWAITVLLLGSRAWDAVRGRDSVRAITEVVGRFWGVCVVIWRPPVLTNDA